MTALTLLKQRQAIYWHLVGSVYGLKDVGFSFQTMTKALVDQLDLPQAILDSGISLGRVAASLSQFAASL